MNDTLTLKTGSARLQQLLETGRLRHPDGRLLRARPLAVHGDDVEIALSDLPETPAPISAWVAAIRPPSLTATLMPSVAVLLHGAIAGWTLSPWIALASIVGVLCLQVAVNLLNDVEDHRRLIDLPGGLGGAGLIQAGLLAPAELRKVARAFALSGLLLGLPAFFTDPLVFTGVGLAALLGGLGYSSGPGLKYRALGDLAVIALCGPLLTGAVAWAAFGQLDPAVIGLGLALALAAVGLLHVNNFQDMRVDRERSVRTLALALGPAGARAYLGLVYLLAFTAWLVTATALMALPPLAIALPLLAAIPALIVSVRLIRADSPESIKDARQHAALIHLLFGVLICGVLAYAAL